MDADRFDMLTRALTATRSRRGALAALVGGTLGLLSLHEAEAKKKKGKGRRGGKGGKGGKGGTGTPPPPPGTAPPQGTLLCGTCGPCAECQGGNCVPTSNDTPCNGTGRCLNGTCNSRPTCFPTGTRGCTFGVPNQCCGSGVCFRESSGSTICQTPGAVGTPCLSGDDCISEECTGYRCASGGCASCPLNETCVAGQCRCRGGASAVPMTCCPSSFGDAEKLCALTQGGFAVVAETCAGVTTCPPGTTRCTGPQCVACCPTATSTCDPGGVCLQPAGAV